MDHLDPFQEIEESRTLKLCHHHGGTFKGIVIFASLLSNLEEYHCLRRFGFWFCINARQTERACYLSSLVVEGMSIAK